MTFVNKLFQASRAAIFTECHLAHVYEHSVAGIVSSRALAMVRHF